MSRKHDLNVVSVDKKTPDSVVVTLEKMPDHTYVSGQYLALELSVNGEEVHRSYSFCSAPFEDHWQIGVKKVPNGKASTYLNDVLTVGEKITCLEPMGNFVLPEVAPEKTHYLFFAAGSGITPIYSMIKTLLNQGNAGKITLFYGNKSPEKTMFGNELNALSQASSECNIEFIYSELGATDPLHKGRIHFGKTLELLRLHPSGAHTPHAFICGPGDMITSVQNALTDSGFSEKQIHTEFFTAPTSKEETSKTEAPVEDTTPFSGTASINIILDDEEHTITLKDGGDVILDAALNAGLDAPFSCKGGVCTACRAKVTKGKVEMMSNFALTDGEIEEGFILTCQSHPKSDKIALSYDE
ncbi:MAG: 2Fe-2S iron-sulfur cluster-binding protein [Flavobacteriales bacterium]